MEFGLQRSLQRSSVRNRVKGDEGVRKEDYRKLALERRNRLTQEEHIDKNRKIIVELMATENWNKAERVLIYCSYLTEVSTKEVITVALRARKKVYCPKITDEKNKQMEFYRIYSQRDLKPGFKGIPEPVTQEQYITDDFADSEKGATLVILPGTAFDHKGNRIGYNGGYYDRYLMRIPYASKVAVAFSCQIFGETLPVEPYDVKADMIITEDHIFR